MTFTERIRLAFSLLKSADGLEGLVAHIEGLKGVLERLEGIQLRLPDKSVLETLAVRLESLDALLTKIESPAPPVIVKEQNTVKADLQEWNRLKLLSQFVHLSGKAREIELEWQRIQQDEHDFLFAFQASNSEETQAKYLYKKGIADGVKWCVKQFS